MAGVWPGLRLFLSAREEGDEAAQGKGAGFWVGFVMGGPRVSPNKSWCKVHPKEQHAESGFLCATRQQGQLFGPQFPCLCGRGNRSVPVIALSCEG